MLRSIVTFGFVTAFSTTTFAQTSITNIHPLLSAAFKNTDKPVYLDLTEYLKPRIYEVRCFSLSPTLAEIEARCREWERRNKKTIGGQIASDIADDIIKTQVNSLIYGKKKPVAVIPKF